MGGFSFLFLFYIVHVIKGVLEDVVARGRYRGSGLYLLESPAPPGGGGEGLI